MSYTVRALLRGGLGNQLFMYAMARKIALRNNARLILDAKTLFRYDKKYNRTFQLDKFTLSPDVEILYKAKPFDRVWRKWMAWKETNQSIKERSFIVEPASKEYDKIFDNFILNHNITIFGYWQSLGYFYDVADIIKEDLCIREPINSKNFSLLEEIADKESIAVHIRKEQYAVSVGLNYYLKALDIMRQQFPNEQYYCFSDDPDWCKSTLGNEYKLNIIDNRSLSDIEDFKLMSKCKHFIIANSSFSWWAALLGSDKNSVVLMPSEKIWPLARKNNSPVNWQTIDN